MALIQISKPQAEPVGLEEMKAHLRIDYDKEDALIEQYITAARTRLERLTGRCFVEQEWELQSDSFESAIEIPKPPTVGLVSVTYISSAGPEVTVDPADYALVQGGEFQPATLIWNTAFPTSLATRGDAARIRFKAGWPAETGGAEPDYAANVPGDIKQAILNLATHYAENREAVALTPVRQELQVMPMLVAEQIAPYILMRL